MNGKFDISRLYSKHKFIFLFANMEDETCTFIFKSIENTVPIRYDLLQSINPQIRRSLYNDHYYLIKSDVSQEVFQTYITYWKTDIFPIEIVNVDNMDEFELFYNEEIRIDLITQILQAKKQQFDEPAINLSILRNTRFLDKSNAELNISQKLDIYIRTHSEDLLSSPIQSLYNIFNNPRRNLTEYDLLYNEIKNFAERHQKIEIFVLHQFIDYFQLNNDNKKDSILYASNRMNLMPKIDGNEVIRLENTKNDLLQQNNQLQTENQQLKATIQNTYNRLENSLHEIVSAINNLESNLNKVQNKFSNLHDIINKKNIRINRLQDDIMLLLYKKRDFDSIKYCISRNMIDINSRLIFYDKHTSLLYLAIEDDEVDLVRILLESPEIDVNFETCLYTYTSNHDVMKEYIRTPLSLAIEKGNIDIVRLLLSNDRINVNARDIDCQEYEDRDNICFYKVMNFMDICKIDIEEEYQSSSKHPINQKSPLIIAVEHGNIEIVRLLLSFPNIDINFISNIGKKEKLNIEWQEVSALYIAVDRGMVDIVNLLLSNPDINVNQYYMYKYSKIKHRTEITHYYSCINYMTKRIVNGYKYRIRKTVLIKAIENENVSIVRSLINCHNLNVNDVMYENYFSMRYSYREYYTKSPLYLAVLLLHRKLVELLLSCTNIDVNYESSSFGNKKQTALNLAQQKDYKSIISLLENH